MTNQSLQRFVLVALLAGWFSTSCATNHAPRDLKASVSTIRQYGNSFLGLSMPDARKRLSGAKVKEGNWHSGEFGGPQLEATFSDYELDLLFYKGKAITTSFQVLTK